MMKNFAIYSICAILIILMGCSSATNESEQVSDVQYIRLYKVSHHANLIPNTVIHSPIELNSFYEQNKDQYDLERREHLAENSATGFLDACDKYTEDFFTSHNLFLLGIEEPSGSIRHEVISINEMDDGFYHVIVRKIIPDAGTDDLATWLLLIEVGKEINDEKSIIVDFES